MKKINFVGDDGALKRDAYAIWLAHKYFPADEHSRRQATMIIEDERQRFAASKGENWEPSTLAAKMVEWAGGKTGQLIAASYTALAFIFLAQRVAKQPTLYAASKLVANSIEAYKGFDPLPIKTYRFNGQWTKEAQRLPTGSRDIRKAFEAHREVAHLAAADSATFEHFQLMHIFNRTPETFAMTLLTAQSFERTLSECASKDFFGYWSVLDNTPVEAEAMVPASIEGGILAFLEAGL